MLDTTAVTSGRVFGSQPIQRRAESNDRAMQRVEAFAVSPERTQSRLANASFSREALLVSPGFSDKRIETFNIGKAHGSTLIAVCRDAKHDSRRLAIDLTKGNSQILACPPPWSRHKGTKHAPHPVSS